MAPTAPKKRPSIRTKSKPASMSKAGSGMFATSHFSDSTSSAFLNTKKDKRLIKSSSFLNRIEKTHKKPLKRRRPNKKLVTNLESLGDALEGMVEEEGLEAKADGKMKMKGIKSRPGATKRREKLERMERERFGKNMAQLIGGANIEEPNPVDTMAVKSDTAEAPSNPTAGRWAALRGFISQTLEQKEEFKN